MTTGIPKTTKAVTPIRRTTQPAAPPTTQPTVSTTTAVTAGLSLLVEPEGGIGPIYDFISSARHTLDMTMYELSDPRAEQLFIADEQKGDLSKGAFGS